MQLNLYNPFLFVFFIIDTESVEEEFCNVPKFQSTWYCNKGNGIEYPDENTCGAYWKNSTTGWLDVEDQKRIVKKINDMRVQLTKGTTNKGVTYPSSGDMVEIKYSQELARSAQGHVRTCTEKLSEKKDRLIPRFNSTAYYIDILKNQATHTTKSELGDPIEKSFEKWIQNDFSRLKHYKDSFTKYDPVSHGILIFNKYRLIGCGRVVFYSERDKIWKFFMECLLAAGNLSLSKIYPENAKNKKGCGACPSKTRCAKQGDYANILCAYSDSMMIDFNRYLLMVTMLAVRVSVLLTKSN